MQFLNLPNELILLIADELVATDVNSLLRTTRHLAELLTPRLHTLASEDKDGSPALCWAVQHSFEPLVRLLLSKKDIDIEVTYACTTPLYIATDNADEVIVRLLLEHGAAADTENLYRGTPFHKAIEDDRTGVIVKAFLENGVDPDMLDRREKTGLFIAAEVGDVEIVKLLLDYGANIEALSRTKCTPLHQAAWQGRDVIARELLERGANINARRKDGSTALYGASENGYETVVSLLIESGADISLTDSRGRTALHRATYNGFDPVVKVLLEAGADYEAKCYAGNTALYIAAENGFGTIVGLLLDRDADITVQNPTTGRTPLHVAARYGTEEIVRMLLKKGADVRFEDFRGDTALKLAKMGGVKEAVPLLQSSAL